MSGNGMNGKVQRTLTDAGFGTTGQEAHQKLPKSWDSES